MSGQRWRTLIHISRLEGETAVGYIWAWRTDECVRFPVSRLPVPLPTDSLPWLFIGRARIGENKMEDLDILVDEIAPEPDVTDGLA